MSDTPVSTRQFLARREKELRVDRESWLAHWQDLADYISPRMNIRLSNSPPQQTYRGSKVGHKILDATGTKAAHTLAAGMMSGLTSPARPWFVLGLDDEDLAQWGPVREWLDLVRQRMLALFAKSNLYNVLHQLYLEQGVFGTGCLMIQEDASDVLRAYHVQVGEYMLANSSRIECDTLYRTYAMTVGQVVQQFGLDKSSQAIKNLYDRGSLSHTVNVVHAIEPNPRGTHNHAPDANWARAFAADMPYRSVYYEQAADKEDQLLAESGYHDQPFMAPRWDVYGNDAYGRGPGMDALADVRQLQGMTKRLAQGVDKQTNPPMVASTSLQNQSVNLLPGGVTFLPPTELEQFKPAYLAPLNLNDMRLLIQDKQQSIRQAFFADLFLMISQMESGGGKQFPTATEIQVRQEEKMLMLGPVVERNQNELLNPLIERAFSIMTRRQLLPPAPREIQGQHFNVDYVSVLAQAQRSASTTSIERLVAFVGNLAAARPDALAKIDVFEAIDAYADALLVPGKIVVDSDKAQKTVQAQQQAQQNMQAAQASMAAVQGAQTLSKTDVGGGQNALQTMLSALPSANKVAV